MRLLQHDRRAAALSCGTAIAAIAAHGAATSHDAYGLADIQGKIEVLARAAEALGQADAAAAYRQMIQRPPGIPDEDWPHYLEARRTRIRQLNERLNQIERYPRGLPDDPVPLLRQILAEARARGA